MSEARKESVGETAEQILEPLAAFMMSGRLGVGDCFARVKVAYVRAVLNRYAAEGAERPTISRIAVETGLTRADVRAILKQEHAQPLPFARGRSRAERVLRAWWKDPQYLDRDDRPLLLDPWGPAPSFAALCERYSGTQRVQPIADELLKAKAIRKLRDGKFQAVRQTSVNVQWDRESLAEVALQLRQHFEALLENLNAPQDPQFVRFFQSVPIESVQAAILTRSFKEQADLLVTRANDQLSRPQHAASPEEVLEGKTRQVTVGVQILSNPIRGDAAPRLTAVPQRRGARSRKPTRS